MLLNSRLSSWSILFGWCHSIWVNLLPFFWELWANDIYFGFCFFHFQYIDNSVAWVTHEFLILFSIWSLGGGGRWKDITHKSAFYYPFYARQLVRIILAKSKCSLLLKEWHIGSKDSRVQHNCHVSIKKILRRHLKKII